LTIERFPVEATHTMMFARSIGDPNPAFADPESPEAAALGGVVAPPTFAMAGFQFDPDNPLRPEPGKPWFGSGREPSGEQREGGGTLHAEQHFEYHQPVRAGMVLTTRQHVGRVWDKQSRSGATLHFSETITEFREADTDALVVTATMVGVKSEPPAEAEG
jgi:acyl dehydratase